MESTHISNSTVIVKSAERLRFVDRVYRAALAEHPKLKDIPEPDVKGVIQRSAMEIEELERVANIRTAFSALTPEVAKKISALWVFSGPGTYDEPVKEDSYRKYPWARWMDRTRLSYAALLTRKISEKVSGIKLSANVNEIPAKIGETRRMIAEYGPSIIYNGTEQENSIVRNVPTREGIVIPPQKVKVMGHGVNNTVDQIRDFMLPKELYRPGEEIGIISHAPHLMRITHMLSQYPTLPKDMKVRLFPVASPAEGREEYAETEIRALLYYIFLGKNAKEKAYPCVIHGKE